VWMLAAALPVTCSGMTDPKKIFQRAIPGPSEHALHTPLCPAHVQHCACACAASHLTALPQAPRATAYWRGISSRTIGAKANRATQPLDASVPPDMTPLAGAPAKNIRHCFNVSVSAVTATGAQIVSAYLCLHVCHEGAVVRSSQARGSRWR
jgi:hypothetical protein